MYNQPLTVRLEPEVEDEVRRLADEEERTPTNMIRRLIHEALDARRKRRVK